MMTSFSRIDRLSLPKISHLCSMVTFSSHSVKPVFPFLTLLTPNASVWRGCGVAMEADRQEVNISSAKDQSDCVLFGQSHVAIVG